jgi:hypothetical protein
MRKYFKILFVSAVLTALIFSISCTAIIDNKSITGNYSGSTSMSGLNEKAPLPSSEDIVRLFFDLINEERIPEAIDMMTDEMAGDDSSRQMWGVQFNRIESIKVQTIEPYLETNWTDSQKMFKVVLEVFMSEKAKDEPIPFFGWDSNPNARWISIKKDANGLWKIDSLATGP